MLIYRASYYVDEEKDNSVKGDFQIQLRCSVLGEYPPSPQPEPTTPSVSLLIPVFCLFHMHLLSSHSRFYFIKQTTYLFYALNNKLPMCQSYNSFFYIYNLQSVLIPTILYMILATAFFWDERNDIHRSWLAPHHPEKWWELCFLTPTMYHMWSTIYYDVHLMVCHITFQINGRLT